MFLEGKIDYFNDGLINVLFYNSIIIEGVNTSAKNIVYFDNKKGDALDIDYFDYSNVKGCVGRLMQHYSGNAFNYNPPPEKEAIYIDMPFFEQNPINEERLLFKKNSINIRGQKTLGLFKVKYA